MFWNKKNYNISPVLCVLFILIPGLISSIIVVYSNLYIKYILSDTVSLWRLKCKSVII